MRNILIFGASGHGSVVLDCIEKENKYSVAGFIDSFKKKGTKINGHQVLGGEGDLLDVIEKYRVYGGIVAVGDNWQRKLFVERILELYPSFKFINAIHPAAIIGKDISLGIGNAIMPGAVVNANSIVGDFCILNTNAILEHDGLMGNYASMAQSVSTGGGVSLGEYTAVGLGAKIINNINIDKQSVIGPGSLVMKDCEAFAVVSGSPAVKLHNRKAGDAYLNIFNYNNYPFPVFTNDY